MTGHDPNNYLTRIPLSKYFFGANSPIFRNLNIGQLLGKLLASNVHDKLLFFVEIDIIICEYSFIFNELITEDKLPNNKCDVGNFWD